MNDRRATALRVGEPLRAGLLLRLRPYVGNELQVVCGHGPCAARVAVVHRPRNRAVHEIWLDIMFEETLGTDGRIPTVELRPRYAEQWARAKRRGVAWSGFRPEGRRPLRNGDREVDAAWEPLPGTSFRFVCPSCRRPNIAEVPPECTPDCPYHCPRCGGEFWPDRPGECWSADPDTLERCVPR